MHEIFFDTNSRAMQHKVLKDMMMHNTPYIKGKEKKIFKQTSGAEVPTQPSIEKYYSNSAARRSWPLSSASVNRPRPQRTAHQPRRHSSLRPIPGPSCQMVGIRESVRR
jgi:hypothetical protein